MTALYPSMDVLPENLLKFYIHFSAPMSRGDVYRQIELREESGQRVELPFLELGEELWNPEQTRLTVILDPGRIKRGLRPLEEEGPALVQGRRYTLFIHKDWLDSEGIPLAADHEKTFLVGGADRTPPDLARWQLRTPAAGTREPLKVEFDEPLDQALALRLLEVHDRSGSRIQGRAALSTNEREWQFVPEADWRRRDYVLSVKKVLEDLAGNNIGKVFDVDLTVADPLHGSPTSLEPTASLRFHPGQ